MKSPSDSDIFIFVQFWYKLFSILTQIGVTAKTLKVLEKSVFLQNAMKDGNFVIAVQN